MLAELRQQVKIEQQHQLELAREVDAGKKTVNELQDEISRLESRDRESSALVRELEASVGWLHASTETAQRDARMLRDKVVEKDRLLEAAWTSLDTAEKQNEQLKNQVDYCTNYGGSQVPTFVQRPGTPRRHHNHTTTTSHHSTRKK